MLRHKKLLHFRKIKHICFMKKVNLRLLTLKHIRSQPSFVDQEYIKKLTQEERRIIRQSNPSYPPTLFMTQQQKEAFYDQMSRNFNQLIECSQPRICKSKKIVKFMGKIQHLYDPNQQIVETLDSDDD